MKTIDTIEKKSIFKKIIDSLKNTFLYKILISENYGISLDSGEINHDEKINALAETTTATKDEIMSIDVAFKQANTKINNFIPTVSSQDKNNPFKVAKKDLNPQGTVTKAPRAEEKDIERD